MRLMCLRYYREELCVYMAIVVCLALRFCGLCSDGISNTGLDLRGESKRKTRTGHSKVSFRLNLPEP